MGRLYAGDLLQFEDLVAALSDFTQTIDLGTVRIGDSSIGLVKYAASEVRLTAALRTDGILRGLGGLYGGAFTTTERNALSQSLRPHGLIILNSTENRYEWNSGTDVSPNWQPMVAIPTAVPAGAIMSFAGAAAPSGYLICDGAAILRSTYSVLFTAIGTTWGVGDDSTTFNLPDLRGRVVAGVGTHGDVDAVGETDGRPVQYRRPKHSHTVADPGHTHGYQNPAFQDQYAAGGQKKAAWREIYGPTGAATTGVTVGADPANDSLDAPAYATMNWIIATGA